MREYLIAYRNKAGVSQRYVAKMLGISVQYYQMIEKGTRQKNMNITLIAKLADIFQVSIQEIVAQERLLTSPKSNISCVQ